MDCSQKYEKIRSDKTVNKCLGGGREKVSESKRETERVRERDRESKRDRESERDRESKKIGRASCRERV